MGMRRFGMGALLAAASAFPAMADSQIASYSVAGKGPPFEIAAGTKSWRIAWQCTSDMVPISFTNPDNGHLVDAIFSFGGKGEDIKSATGRLRTDTRDKTCSIVISKVD
jgi:hypothetical protein